MVFFEVLSLISEATLNPHVPFAKKSLLKFFFWQCREEFGNFAKSICSTDSNLYLLISFLKLKKANSYMGLGPANGRHGGEGGTISFCSINCWVNFAALSSGSNHLCFSSGHFFAMCSHNIFKTCYSIYLLIFDCSVLSHVGLPLKRGARTYRTKNSGGIESTPSCKIEVKRQFSTKWAQLDLVLKLMSLSRASHKPHVNIF